MSREETAYSVQTVAKALDLLEMLSAECITATVPALAQKLKISNQQLTGLLTILEARGFVERDAPTGIYRIGLGALEMAQSIFNSDCLLKMAYPVMENLARKHDEAIYMAVLDNDEVLFLHMIDSLQQDRTPPLVGRRFPFYTNAPGKVIKAMSSYDVRERYGKRWALKAGIHNLHEFESELETIRKSGIAVDTGGLGEGISAVAVVIQDYAGKVMGALAILAPSFRMPTERLEREIIPSVREGAEVLSRKFGYSRTSA